MRIKLHDQNQGDSVIADTGDKRCTFTSIHLMDERMEEVAPKQVSTCEKNGNLTTAEEDRNSSGESGIDETEFKTSREESEKLFSRPNTAGRLPFSFQDMLDTLNAKKLARADTLSHVDLDPLTNRLHLKVDRSNIRTRFGYDSGRQAFLYPEEALYLLDMGKIEIFVHHVSLSVQRARSRLLVSQRADNSDRIAHCTPDEFHVYKDLTTKGYCLYRHRQCDILENFGNAANCNQGLEAVRMEEDVIIDESVAAGKGSETDDVIEIEPSGDNTSGILTIQSLKRKHSPSLSDEEASDITDEIMEDFDGPLETPGGASYLVNTEGDRFESQVEPGGYTVDEADSDVEIVDEVIYSHAGVEIQEIGHSSGYHEDFMEDSEPVPSTSKGPPPPTQVVVDLVSSEEEGEDLRSFANKIWSKFVPNSKHYIKVPPISLIPDNIPPTDKVYEFDLKDKSDMSDLELEFLVDEVSLNDESHNVHSNLSTAENWKEWRKNIFREARDVMNDSLLASSEYVNGAAASEKLLLWSDCKSEHTKQGSFINRIVYEVYGTVEQGFSRLKSFQGKPMYYVAILREKETIPDLKSFGSSVDGVPIINAIVCDTEDIVYMKGDSSPLNSLF